MAERAIPTVIEVGADAVPSVRLYKKSAWRTNLWVVRHSICSVVSDIFQPLYWVSAYLNILTNRNALTIPENYKIWYRIRRRLWSSWKIIAILLYMCFSSSFSSLNYFQSCNKIKCSLLTQMSRLYFNRLYSTVEIPRIVTPRAKVVCLQQ